MVALRDLSCSPHNPFHVHTLVYFLTHSHRALDVSTFQVCGLNGLYITKQVESPN
jgi:hypothetical protein